MKKFPCISSNKCVKSYWNTPVQAHIWIRHSWQVICAVCHADRIKLDVIEAATFGGHMSVLFAYQTGWEKYDIKHHEKHHIGEKLKPPHSCSLLGFQIPSSKALLQAPLQTQTSWEKSIWKWGMRSKMWGGWRWGEIYLLFNPTLYMIKQNCAKHNNWALYFSI